MAHEKQPKLVFKDQFEAQLAAAAITLRRTLLLQMAEDKQITPDEFAALYESTGSIDTVNEDLQRFRTRDVSENGPSGRLMRMRLRLPRDQE